MEHLQLVVYSTLLVQRAVQSIKNNECYGLLNFIKVSVFSWTETYTRGADKSLAPPGRKQAKATTLGIYPTYPPKKLKTLLSPLL